MRPFSRLTRSKLLASSQGSDAFLHDVRSSSPRLLARSLTQSKAESAAEANENRNHPGISAQGDSRPVGDGTTTCRQDSPDGLPKSRMTVAERDAAIMSRWQERQGSLANAEFEDGQVAEGYRRNVKANIFRYI